MRAKVSALGVAMFAVAATVRASPPINDDFTNRTILVGSSITFTATLAEATLELWESIQPGCAWLNPIGNVGNVWFQWMGAPEGPIYIVPEVLTTNFWWDTLTIFSTTNGIEHAYEGGVPIRACMALAPYSHLPVWGFEGPAELSHYIRVQGVSGGTFAIRMFSSVDPLILEQPRNITVTPGGSALLTVTAFSISPLTYTWFHNGSAMPGEITSMLMITNCVPAANGQYFVEVQNATGVSTSAVASVVVSDQIRAPELSIQAHSGSIDLSVAADEGRSYRIESTGDPIGWTNESMLVSGEVVNHWSSVVWQTGPKTTFNFDMLGGTKLFRASSYQPLNDVCNANLKRLHHVKQLWARDAMKPPPYTPTIQDLTNYFKDIRLPQCPVGGTYPYTELRDWPRCNVPGHVLEEPQ